VLPGFIPGFPVEFLLLTYFGFYVVNLNSPGTPVLSTSVADHYNITEILLNVAFNTITLTDCLLLPLSLKGTPVPAEIL
jgi:hypothetical protein